MVGYNKRSLVDFISIMDSYSVESVATKAKIRASFYKILISNEDKLQTYKKEVFSVLVMLFALYYKKSIKFEKKPFQGIALDVISHELNRALYQQARIESAITKPSDAPMVQLMAMDSIGASKFAYVIALLMVYFKMDLQDLLVDTEFARKILDRNLFLGDSFVTLEEIADASENYNS